MGDNDFDNEEAADPSSPFMMLMTMLLILYNQFSIKGVPKNIMVHQRLNTNYEMIIFALAENA